MPGSSDVPCDSPGMPKILLPSSNSILSLGEVLKSSLQSLLSSGSSSSADMAADYTRDNDAAFAGLQSHVAVHKSQQDVTRVYRPEKPKLIELVSCQHSLSFENSHSSAKVSPVPIQRSMSSCSIILSAGNKGDSGDARSTRNSASEQSQPVGMVTISTTDPELPGTDSVRPSPLVPAPTPPGTHPTPLVAVLPPALKRKGKPANLPASSTHLPPTRKMSPTPPHSPSLRTPPLISISPPPTNWSILPHQRGSREKHINGQKIAIEPENDEKHREQALLSRRHSSTPTSVPLEWDPAAEDISQRRRSTSSACSSLPEDGSPTREWYTQPRRPSASQLSQLDSQLPESPVCGVSGRWSSSTEKTYRGDRAEDTADYEILEDAPKQPRPALPIRASGFQRKFSISGVFRGAPSFCKCTLCKHSDTGLVCCAKVPELLFLFELNEVCVTRTALFQNMVLSKAGLKYGDWVGKKWLCTELIHENKNNRAYRHLAYNAFVNLVSSHMRKQWSRKTLPCCVVLEIRRAYPSTDGSYSGEVRST